MRQVLATLAMGMLMSAAASAQPLSPRVTNWEEYFQVDWQVGERGGQPMLTGHVSSVQKYGAQWMQLLVDRLDASGALIDQRLVWLPSAVPRRSRVYFEMSVEPAASYRVAVFDYVLPSLP